MMIIQRKLLLPFWGRGVSTEPQLHWVSDMTLEKEPWGELKLESYVIPLAQGQDPQPSAWH